MSMMASKSELTSSETLGRARYTDKRPIAKRMWATIITTRSLAR